MANLANQHTLRTSRGSAFTLRPLLTCGMALLALLVLALLAPTSAAAQTLPLIAVDDGETTEFWWSAPSAAPTALDEALLDTDFGLIAPRPAATASLASLYRRPDLPPRNARLLASELGASSLLLGVAEAPPARPVAGELVWVAEVHLAASWLSVADESRERLAEVAVIGEGSDAQEAQRAAFEAAASALYQQLVGNATAGASNTGGTAGGRPPLDLASAAQTLVVRGLERAPALVAFKGDLRLREAVVADVWEAWASEGIVGLRVDLQPGASWRELEAVVDELAAAAGSYQLVVTSAAQGSLEVELTEIDAR